MSKFLKKKQTKNNNEQFTRAQALEIINNNISNEKLNKLARIALSPQKEKYLKYLNFINI